MSALAHLKRLFRERFNYVIESKPSVCYSPSFSSVIVNNEVIFIGTDKQCQDYQARREKRLVLKDSEIVVCNMCFGIWIRESLSAFSTN